MADADTLAAANVYTGAALKDHTDADDPHAYIDPTHGAGYVELVDQNLVRIGKPIAILVAGDSQPDPTQTAAIFDGGSAAGVGVYAPSDGQGGWVNITGSPAPVDTTPPTSPSGLVVSNQTASSFTLTWTGSTDASGIARYETKLDGGAWVSNGTVLSRSFTGLALGDHTVQVRAVDKSAAGNVSTAAQKTVTLVSSGGGGGGGTKVTTLMGVNFDTQGSEYDALWPALRVYSTGKVATAISQGAKYIAFTDEPGISVTGGAASATKVQALLNTTYGGPGAPSKNKDVFIGVGNGNEVDTNFANGMNGTQFADTSEAMKAVTDQYDNAAFLIDLTRFHIGTGDSARLLATKSTSGKTVGSMLDGLAGSYYPPGQDSGSYGYPTVLATMYTTSADTPSGIVDGYMPLAAQYGITRMEIWEFGIPAAINPPPAFGSPGSIYQDKNARPTWVKNLIEYWMTACLSHGMDPYACFYWDQQVGTPKGGTTNSNHDDRFTTDTWFTPDPSPTTAGAVFNAATNYNATH